MVLDSPAILTWEPVTLWIQTRRSFGFFTSFKHAKRTVTGSHSCADLLLFFLEEVRFLFLPVINFKVWSCSLYSFIEFAISSLWLLSSLSSLIIFTTVWINVHVTPIWTGIFSPSYMFFSIFFWPCPILFSLKFSLLESRGYTHIQLANNPVVILTKLCFYFF